MTGYRILAFLGAVVLFLIGGALMGFSIYFDEPDSLWPVANALGAFIAIILASIALYWSLEK